jgi:hypothetical protein
MVRTLVVLKLRSLAEAEPGTPGDLLNFLPSVAFRRFDNVIMARSRALVIASVTSVYSRSGDVRSGKSAILEW